MTVTLFNTLSGKKEELKTHTPGKVTMYCCGVTPYNSTHIGHCRTFFSYDLLYRTLRDDGQDIKWARNITDVDDKIIKKANDENVSCETIVNRYVGEQDKMLKDFYLYRPMFEPKVTDNIQQIIDIIDKLIKTDFAYVSESGIYFRIKKFPTYGNLSGNNVDELRKGARIEVDENKEDGIDFALWKFAKPGEIKWNSPWGEGRPGWHIECSAMIHNIFGDSIDIHMGGRDLIFPHHECEIAQSEASTGKQFSKFWLYAGMVTFDGLKMSKSTSHFVSIKDFLEKYPAEVLRLLFLSASYTAPVDFTFDLADQNLKKLSRLYRFVSLVDNMGTASVAQRSASPKTSPAKPYEQSIFKALPELVTKMRMCMRDDLNSSSALALFFDFVKSVNAELSLLEKKGCTLNDGDHNILRLHWTPTIAWIRDSLGVLLEDPTQFFANLAKFKLGEISPAQIDEKIVARDAARAAKDWKAADVVRDELLAAGVLIQDTPNGTKWTVSL